MASDIDPLKICMVAGAIVRSTYYSSPSVYHSIRKVIEAVRAGKVNRWHTVPTAAKQTNAEHQWSVAVIILSIYPDCSINLLKAALMHDAHEKVFGDVPRPAFEGLPDLKEKDNEARDKFVDQYHKNLFGELTDKEKKVLAFADRLEHYIHIANLADDKAEIAEAIKEEIAGWGIGL